MFQPLSSKALKHIFNFQHLRRLIHINGFTQEFVGFRARTLSILLKEEIRMRATKGRLRAKTCLSPDPRGILIFYEEKCGSHEV